MRGIVVRSEPAVKAGIDAFGDAAVAREERVAQAGNWLTAKPMRNVMMSGPRCRCRRSSATSVSILGSEMPTTLNIEPSRRGRCRSGVSVRPETVSGNFRRSLGHQGQRARLDAEALEEFALRRPARATRAPTSSRRAAERLEIHMRGDIGLAGILQRIGTAVRCAIACRVSPASLRTWP